MVEKVFAKLSNVAPSRVLQVSRRVGSVSSLSMFVIRVSSSIGSESSLDSSLVAIVVVAPAGYL